MSLKEYASRKIRRDTAANWALNNPIPLEGEWCLEIDTGNVKIGDEITAWNDLGYYIPAKLAIPYDLTSANKTHTLPPITGAPQTESVYWTGGGTYKLTLAVTDGATVGGETAGTWEGEGEGHILVESDGSNWQVREYEDSGSGVNFWKKTIDGKMRQWKYEEINTFEILSAYGSLYQGNKFYAFEKEFITIEHGDCSYAQWGTSASWGTVGGLTISFINIRSIDISSRVSGTMTKIAWEATGTWK